MDAATGGTFSDWGDIQTEFANCGVTISDSPTVTRSDEGGEFFEGRAWLIENGGQTYVVKVEAGILTIYIPPTASQIAYNLVNAIRDLGTAIARYTNYNQFHYPIPPNSSS